MALPPLEERLQVAEEHVARGRQHIARQRQIIAELEADGHNSTRAWQILKAYEDLQRSHEDLHAQLAKRWASGSPLQLKLKSLGAEARDLDIVPRVIKRHAIVGAHDNVILEAGQVKALLAGTTCCYKMKEDGGRSILSFQHPGDFCDLSRYVLPDLDPAIGIRALTDCTLAVINFRDMDGLLSRPTLASALWRASMLEAAIYRERLSRTSRGTALERVAHLVCEQLVRREAVGIHGRQLPFSQVDIADAASLSVVHVNRTIQTLRSLNVLSKGNHAIEVIDRKELEKIAGFDGRYLRI